MKITPKEAMSLGIWDKVCELSGINVWALNEGLIDENKELEIEIGEDR